MLRNSGEVQERRTRNGDGGRRIDRGIKIKNQGRCRAGLWQKQNDIEYVVAREGIDSAKDLNTSLRNSLASSTVRQVFVGVPLLHRRH